MPDLAFLVLSQDEPHRAYLCSPQDYLGRAGSDRVSPLLSFSSAPSLPPIDGNFELALVFHSDPVEACDRLRRQHAGLKFPGGLDRLSRVWLTVGLASVVIAADTDEDLQLLLKTLTASAGFAGFEKWAIRAGCISGDPDCTNAPIVIREGIDLASLSNIPTDLYDVYLEVALNLAAISAHARVYAPKYVAFFDGARQDFDELLEDALALSAEPDRSKRNKATLQLLSSGIELAAALAYIESQWFTGRSPILGNPAQIRPYSLLGIGTAACALGKCVEQITQAVYDSRAEDTFKDSLLPSKSFDICKGPVEDRLQQWKSVGLDTQPIPDGESAPLRPLLTYYSSRRGFRESNFSITAPTSSLRRGFTRRWSLRNITHELLHAHVTKLLSDLGNYSEDWLKSQLAKSPDLFPTSSVDKYDLAELLDSNPSRLGPTTAGISLWVSLYIALRKIEGSDPDYTNSPPEIKKRRMRARRLFKVHFAELNEIIVHVLDFRYFFKRAPEDYVVSLWSSWSLVPAVWEELPFYVRRTVLAMSIVYEGPPSSRIDQATAEFTRIITTSKDLSDTPIALVVDEYLNSAAWNMEGLTKAIDRVYLVDLIETMFTSDGLASQFLTDRNYESDGAYAIRPFSFTEQRVYSPTAFIASLESFGCDGQDGLCLTMWALLHLASSKNSLEDPNSDVF